ncbi:unnamed protein product [Adineta steineri]|uniref:VCBS repeat-containing protein n=1 Tax=Adineta steineri TaxID=433720 RepID=A0A814T621_9BILA|nr:unnamed protein product [Adineta steineri]CAF1342181.1 unnamed protein product [Adineta steineri]
MVTIIVFALLAFHSLTVFGTTQPLIIFSKHSSELTLNSGIYTRNGSSGVNYYYEAIEVQVNTTGNYTFTSSSSIEDTYGYLYQRNFYPSAPSYNIVSKDDNGAGNGQFQVIAALRSDTKYILVFTTFHENNTGSFSILTSGPDNVFNPIEVLSTTTPMPICDTLEFKEQPMLNTSGTAPQSAISADFNNDGHSDLAVTNYDTNTVSIFLGIGNGSFQSPSMNFSTKGINPYWLVANDFNSDGNLDLAITNEQSNTVAILLGLGNGSFKLPAITFASGGSLPSSIIATDLNNDNKIDLVVTNTGSDNITVFLGIGNGTFQLPGKSYTAASLPSSITSGDFNGDDNIDLAVVSRGSNKLLIYFGLGNGTLWSNFTSYTTGLFPYVVRSADFNGDSKLDLVVGNFYSNSISIFLGTGTGTFIMASPSTYPTTGAGPIDIAIQDLNGDAVVDLAVSNQIGNTITMFLSNGNGTFQQGKNYSSTGKKLQSIIAQDFNEDGMYDLTVTSQNTNALTILLTQCV